MRLDQPGLVIDAARHLGKNVGSVLVAESRGLVDRFAGRVAEGGERCRHGCQVRFFASDPELVPFEKRPLDSHLDRPFGCATESRRTLGDRIRVTLDHICDLVEELMDRDESRPTDIPVRCLTCACRSIAAARCRLSNSADLERIFSESVLDVRYMVSSVTERARGLSVALGNRRAGVHNKVGTDHRPEPVNSGKFG